MAVSLNNTANCVDFFQQAILRMLDYWHNHDAVQTIEVERLDREREVILNVLSRGLEYDAAWPLVRRLITAFASYMERRGHWEAWQDLLQRAIRVAQRVNDTDGETTLTALLARLAQRQSRPQDVVRHYRRVIHLAKRTNNQFELARACSNLGFAYIDGGKWWRSEVLSLRALALFEELKSEHGRAHTHNHLGLLYTQQNRWDVAEENLQKACRLWEGMGDEHGLLSGYGNLGVLYREKANPRDSICYLTKALKQTELIGERIDSGSILNSMGMTYTQMNEIALAKSYFEQAFSVFSEYSNHLGMAQVQHNFGIIALKMVEPRQAKPLLQDALALHLDLKNNDGVTKIWFSLVDCELALDNQDAAKECFQEAERIIDQESKWNKDHEMVQRLQEYRRILQMPERYTVVRAEPSSWNGSQNHP